MRPTLLQTIAFAATAGTALAQDQEDSPEYDNPCKSFGIDFQDEGSYFQNKSSADPFTFVSTFEGCQDDFANNILVDPNGDQVLCSDTPLRPDDTYQISTCPLKKNELSSGDWSVIIISNNGDEGDPIAYMRDFTLKVAEPTTVTTSVTMTITEKTTPIVEATKTAWETETLTNTKTVTSPYTKSKTITQTPKRVTTTKTITLGTITKSAYKVVPTVITKTKTKTCSIPRKQNHRDPWCTITPTVAFAAALETGVSASPTPTAGSTRRRRDALRSQLENREEFLAARKARLAAAQGLEKRGLDLETITIGEPNTSLWKTETAWTTMPASTVTSTVESTTSVTTTSTQTVYKGVTKVITTVTAPTPTKTKTKWTLVRTTSTITRRPTFTTTIKWAPASSTAICKAKGGKLV